MEKHVLHMCVAHWEQWPTLQADTAFFFGAGRLLSVCFQSKRWLVRIKNTLPKRRTSSNLRTQSYLKVCVQNCMPYNALQRQETTRRTLPNCQLIFTKFCRQVCTVSLVDFGLSFRECPQCKYPLCRADPFHCLDGCGMRCHISAPPELHDFKSQ